MGALYQNGEWSIGAMVPEDLTRIAAGIRDEDVRELRAASDKSIVDALRESAEHSAFCLTIKKNDSPLMVFGIAGYSLLASESCCWAVATKELKFSGSKFLRCSREVVAAVNRIYPVMSNYVGAWNRPALRWLKWCGFVVEPARRIGIHGEMMHRVERRDA